MDLNHPPKNASGASKTGRTIIFARNHFLVKLFFVKFSPRIEVND